MNARTTRRGFLETATVAAASGWACPRLFAAETPNGPIAPTIRAAAASVKLTDDNMEPLHATEKVFDRPWEGEFRAAAMVIDAGELICLISLDAQNMRSYISGPIAKRIATATRIPESHVLVCATHTHRGPRTSDIFCGKPNAEYLRRMEEGSVQAAVEAFNALGDPASDARAELLFGQSQEATVGRNSRLLLKDGSIGWYGYEASDVVRPTGPYDPDLYVLATRRADGGFAGLAFNHSVHNIGEIKKGHMSPCFYGLAALELERRHGATTMFLPGAIGSTHNATYKDSGVPAAECVDRVVAAVDEALGRLEPALPGPVQVLNRPFAYQVRRFDEAKQAAAVKSYLEKYDPRTAAGQIEIFRKMREEMAPHQGEERHTRLQVFRLGRLAIVGIPGEMFASLGLEIRRRSPFRHTFIVGLANDQISYLPDRQGYADGGYQTWAGWHSRVEVGTGEAMVDQVIAMLDELHAAG